MSPATDTAAGASGKYDKLYLAGSALLFASMACWWLLSDNGHRATDLAGNPAPAAAAPIAEHPTTASEPSTEIANALTPTRQITAAAALPDSDGDGVNDQLDQCPELAGLASSNGCLPDLDGDGIFDIDDRCPQRAGDDGYGCPAARPTPAEPAAANPADCTPIGDSQTPEHCNDADVDGVTDELDLCPARPGNVSQHGCPADTDNDGISDDADQCPAEKGSALANGCPVASDNDQDGVTNEIDQCPDTHGSAAARGCPADRDADGVADGDDLCPGTSGPIKLRGCPELHDDAAAQATRAAPATTAADASAVSLAAGSAGKISAQDQQILDSAIALVEFEPNSSVLTQRSSSALLRLVNLLNRHPHAILEISGHTDASGDATTNMELSKARARACAEFFVSQGIAFQRLRAAGFGESRPIADNTTQAGRRTNRRVEFNLAANTR